MKHRRKLQKDIFIDRHVEYNDFCSEKNYFSIHKSFLFHSKSTFQTKNFVMKIEYAFYYFITRFCSFPKQVLSVSKFQKCYLNPLLLQEQLHKNDGLYEKNLLQGNNILSCGYTSNSPDGSLLINPAV